MITKIKAFTEPQLKTDLPNIRPGDTVKVHQKIKEVAKKTKKGGPEKKERIQVFEGLVLARKHGKEMGATITVRKVTSGIGVERIFPIHSPNIEKIEVVKRGKVRRAKLYYLRTAKGKRARLKQIEMSKSDKISIKIETKEIVDKVEDNTKLENSVNEKTNTENKTKESTIKKGK